MNLLIALLLIVPGVSARSFSLEYAQPEASRLAAGARLALAGAGKAPAPSTPPAGLTPLQKHVAFFDRDGSGVITPGETAHGLRRLGMGRAEAAATAAIIHAVIGPQSSQGFTLNIRVAGIHRSVHGSDTGVYDSRGLFVSAAFDRMFADFDADRSGALNETEIAAMIAANALLRPGGTAAAKQEFGLLLRLAGDREDRGPAGEAVRAISRERLQAFYDGSLFYEIARPAP